jgi:predicted acylesterase/phospholipase RssA
VLLYSSFPYIIGIVQAGQSFSFSGCGWLTPFHLGVVKSMKDGNILTSSSIVAGSSGGSIAALAAVSDVDMDDAMKSVIRMSKADGLYRDIDFHLKKSLEELVPHDIVSKANNKLHVVVTQVKPTFNSKPLYVNQFESKDHVIDCVAASCYIPLYSGGVLNINRLSTHIRAEEKGHGGQRDDRKYVDGGFLHFMPRLKGDYITVSPFPKEYLLSTHVRFLGRPPAICLPFPEYSITSLLPQVLISPSEDGLMKLYHEGRKAADLFMERSAREI